MSKRRKSNRHQKLPIPATAKRGVRVAPAVFVAVAFFVTLSLWWWKVKSADISPPAAVRIEANAANPAAAEGKTEFQKLKGGWRRPDGGYVLAIKDIADRGAMDAAYFNPNPIHVAKAEATKDGGATKIFIELRDVNYPGSTYTLTYDPASDQLTGIYYQAVEQQRFEVVFERMK
jgi:uncharacterized protein (DUF2147 family)